MRQTFPLVTCLLQLINKVKKSRSLEFTCSAHGLKAGPVLHRLSINSAQTCRLEFAWKRINFTYPTLKIRQGFYSADCEGFKSTKCIMYNKCYYLSNIQYILPVCMSFNTDAAFLCSSMTNHKPNRGRISSNWPRRQPQIIDSIQNLKKKKKNA